MADQKISELTNILGADVGAGDEFVVVDSSANETKAITTLELRTAIGNGDFTVTGDLTVQGTTITVDSATAQNIVLGDNDKMTFGAGSDLQIYHDGLHSYIDEAGTGDIYVSVLDDIIFRTYGTNELVARFNTNQSTGGWARLYHRGSEKLETTSTGVDITGTLTSDGLTVNGGYLTVDNGYGITTVGGLKYIADSDNNAPSTGLLHQFLTNTSSLALGIQKNGNVGIGTSSPSADYGSDIALEISGATSPGIVINDTGQASKYGIHADSNDLKITYGSGALATFQNDGNVGIGTSSPKRHLHINDPSAVSTKIQITNSATGSGSDGEGFQLGIGSTGQAAIEQRENQPLTFSTNNSERMRIDASGNVGIGTASPSAKLHVYNGSLTLESSSGTGNVWTYYKNPDQTYLVGLRGSSSDALSFYDLTADEERMRIDSSGNVGIGTTPQSHYTGYTALDLGVSGSIWSNRTTSDTNTIMMANNAYLNSGATNWLRIHADEATRYEQGSGLHRWSYAASGTAGSAISWSEAMRIDSSGNLLVGRTSDANTNGLSLLSSGFFRASTTSTTTGVFNRNTSDGTILAFSKGGTTVGSIGSQGGDSLTIGNGDTGLLISAANDVIHPWNTSTNAARDNAIDLGRSSHRFKDLHLSGGVYLGGTGAANKLDDYEEGTSTVGISAASGSGGTVTGGASGLYWTKIGNQVIVTGNVTVGSLGTLSSAFYITGFPFAAPSSFLQGQGAVRSQGIGASNDIPVVIEMLTNTSNARLHFASGTSGQRTVQVSDISSGDFFAFTLIYQV